MNVTFQAMNGEHCYKEIHAFMIVAREASPSFCSVNTATVMNTSAVNY